MSNNWSYSKQRIDTTTKVQWISKVVEPKLLTKTNRQICFSILTTQKYLKLELDKFKIQVSSTYFQVIRIENQICPFVFWKKFRHDNFIWRSTDL